MRIKLLISSLFALMTMFSIGWNVCADEIFELEYDCIVVDMGYRNSQRVNTADLSDYITTVPSGVSLSELNFRIEDTSIATVVENDTLGTVTIVGKNYGYTHLYVSNDNFADIITVYVVYPRSGSEPNYNPSIWNFPTTIRYDTNCYSYILDLNKYDCVSGLETGFTYNAEPGEIYNKIVNNISNIPDPNSFNTISIRCNDENLARFIQLARIDLLTLNSSLDANATFKCLDLNDNYEDELETALGIVDPNKFNYSCESGTYKVVLVRDEDGWMHWYRQDSNGLWSHKQGSSNATNYDGYANLIFDPIEIQNYKYGGYFYVGCFQVPVWK